MIFELIDRSTSLALNELVDAIINAIYYNGFKTSHPKTNYRPMGILAGVDLNVNM